MAKPKNKAATPAVAAAPVVELNKALLKNIVETSRSNGQGWCFAALTDELAALAVAGLVQYDTNTKDADGAVATAATATGIEMVNDMGFETPGVPKPAFGAASVVAAAPMVAENVQTEPSAFGDYVIETVPMPARTRNSSGIGKAKYPFAALQIGQSFLVKGAELKKFQSTVGAANRRYNTDDTPQDQKRTFTAFEMEDGVRVFRTEWRKPRVMTKKAGATVEAGATA